MSKPETCRFAKSHEWIHFKGHVGSVGVSEHAQKEISDVVFVELPKPGRKVAQGEACAVVESVKAAFDIYAPVAGEIAAVNEALVKDPALINREPHDGGWLFQIKADDAGLASAEALMDLKKYEQFLASGAAAH